MLLQDVAAVSAVLAAFFSSSPSLWANEDTQRDIAIAELPTPPPNVAKLLQVGNVHFVFGPADDARKIDSRRDMAAETSYRIEFNFRTRLRWQTSGASIQVRIVQCQVDWQPVHTVWFRHHPSCDGFWSDRLVQHELDHVRISSHGSFRQIYLDRVEGLGPINGTIQSNETARRAADRLIRKPLLDLFDEVSELIQIRYVELDRQTGHGLVKLADDTSLGEYFVDPP